MEFYNKLLFQGNLLQFSQANYMAAFHQKLCGPIFQDFLDAKESKTSFRGIIFQLFSLHGNLPSLLDLKKQLVAYERQPGENLLNA